MQENVYCIYRNKLEKLGERIIVGICIICAVIFAIIGMIFPFAMMLGRIALTNPDGTPSDIVFFGSMFCVLSLGFLTITGDCVASEYKYAIRDKKTIDDKGLKILGYASVLIFFAMVVPSILYILFITNLGIAQKTFLTLATIGGVYVLLHGMLSFLCEKENYRRYLEASV